MRRLLILCLIFGCARQPEHPLVHRFERAEDWAKEFDDPSRDAWQRPHVVIASMQIPVGSTVADLGTGTGYFLSRLSSAVGPTGRVLALDVEPDMIRYVKQRAQKESLANVEARVVAVDDPQLANESVDRVLVVDTWHHIPSRKDYAKKLAGALRKGGAVFVVDFDERATHGPPKHHRLSPSVVMEELSAAGLRSEQAKVELPEQYVVVGRRD
jgi:ubiquinone/menaquinone biosynthesis C-methylase UbiE